MSIDVIIQSIFFIASLVGVVIRMEIAIAVLKTRLDNAEKNIEALVKENKDDHNKIMEKLDKIIFNCLPNSQK